MSPRLRWRLWYGDGATFDNLRGSWAAAPRDDVMAVAIADPVKGRIVVHGMDYYYAIGSEIFWARDRADLNNALRKFVLGPHNVKFGANERKDRFEAILRAACEDPDFPRTSPRRRESDWSR